MFLIWNVIFGHPSLYPLPFFIFSFYLFGVKIVHQPSAHGRRSAASSQQVVIRSTTSRFISVSGCRSGRAPLSTSLNMYFVYKKNNIFITTVLSREIKQNYTFVYYKAEKYKNVYKTNANKGGLTRIMPSMYRQSHLEYIILKLSVYGQ